MVVTVSDYLSEFYGYKYHLLGALSGLGALGHHAAHQLFTVLDSTMQPHPPCVPSGLPPVCALNH
jgi:hypothetical protein